MPHRIISYPKLAATVLLGFYLLSCLQDPNLSHFIDNLDLIIHEAGHLIFIFFGQFIYILGGSLTQVLIPILFAGYFLLKSDFFSASFVGTWIGYSIINVSIYLGDAQVMRLPLLGGDNVMHDWHYLLSTTGLLNYTDGISHFLYFIGCMIIVACLLFCLRFSVKDDERMPLIIE